jgi:3-oxoacyl-[acyl-carrier protein] reductase
MARVKQKSQSSRILTLEINIRTSNGDPVIEGEAKVKVLKPKPVNPEVSPMPNKDRGAIIITGASGGIGSAVARVLAAAGFPIVIHYHSNETRARELQAPIAADGGRARVFKADIRNQDEVKAMVSDALAEFKTIYGIVNNAAARPEYTAFTDLGWDDFQEHIDVQVKGAYYLASAVLPVMIANHNGSIVNIISSSADGVPPAKLSSYVTAKSALAALTRSLAVEYGPSGIRINAVSPGMTETDMIANFPEKAKVVTKMQTPLRRLALPGDIANAVAFLMSEQSVFLTGETIRVNGGQAMA